jgi:glycerol-3-phosphate acyltransferase PlsX
MRVAVDVMGGDHGCGVAIQGAKRALEANPHIETLFLIGDKAEIHAALPPGGFRDHRVKVIHASEMLTMDDKPVAAIRKKKDASIVRAMEMVNDGKADAVVSLGNTGGIFAAATFKLGRLPGVERGAIAAQIPTQNGFFVLLDAGANVECKPLHLAQFAVMGSAYFRQMFNCARPRVGILSVGTEDTKGNELSLAAFALCKHLDINFVGNVEGHDLFEESVDVVICDGFVGNIVLKTIESLAVAMFTILKHELKASTRRKLGALLAQYAFRAMKKRMDPEVYGGAPMVGFNGSVMKSHGSATDRAVANAIGVAAQNVQSHVNESIARDIAAANQRIAALAAGQTPPATQA